jgi:hypothetical protein
MVDQRTLNPRVVGSSPTSRTKWPCGGMVYAVDLKSTVRKDVGVRVPSRLQSVMKKKTSTTRNGFAVPAKKRKAGEIRSKKDKRKNGKNKQSLYLEDKH